MDILSKQVLVEDIKEIHSRGEGWHEFTDCTILITGAYGMLASYLTDYFIWLNEEHNRNITIIAAVRSEKKARARFGNAVDKAYFKLYSASINDPFCWDESIDYIIHAAGIANPKLYSTIPTQVAEANAIGTYQLLKWASTHPVKGFLYFSTGDIYGKVDGVERITEVDIGVVDPLDLHSCYGESKRMGETWCMNFAKEYQVPTKIARIWHTYSPMVDLENDPRVFSAFVKNALLGENINILSDGSARRAFCYITDAVIAFILILLKGNSGEAYNVSNSDEFHSILELAEIIVEASGKPISVNVKGKRNDGYLENHTNHANKPSEEKLMSIGWKHTVTALDGFSRVLKYLQNTK